ncbi:MAG: molybdopterin-dependent oxidoreductase [Acidobacteriota bacterium]
MAQDELFSSVKKMDEDGVKFGRRRFILALGAAVVGYGGWKYYQSLPQKYHRRKISFITPNEEFYAVSVNMFFRPEIDAAKWRLELTGLDGKKVPLSLDEIRAMPNKLIHYTFCCIENPPGGGSMSNARWRVVSLHELLKPVLPERRDGIRMLATGLDGFYSSIPLDLALDEASYLAYEMNEVPIPLNHGFPVRVLIPGRYGMKQPKWLKKIEITDSKVTGYWEERGWSDDADVKATTRLDRAENIETAGKDILLTGIAFAGKAAVGKVEVSLDGGSSWQQAEIETQPEKNVWSIWKYHWPRPAPGNYTLICRLIDENNKRQIESYTSAFPSGATGLHKVSLTVV